MLRDHWLSLWTRLGGNPAQATRPYDRLVERYSEPHRHYHTLAHIQHCLEEFEAARPVCIDANAVEMAIWFHDAVYVPKAKDNEAQSAELARTVLNVGGFADGVIDEVARLVLVTAHVEEVMESDDASTLVDVDLSILGQSAQTFDEYERQIRREYAWVPDDAYRTGRAAVLERFIARPLIYVTSEYRNYENAARANIARSLERLRRGIILR
jgi:predicted metal-dependent HD superfamily phosphohydrolase